eukprot:CAMPEP_0119116854 /NCGR_PEP_ID=MMETSP1180-20130426/52515_1 /TAXON_ID=3052 ORGANISM="Chlamydomonas cf sp, Strain CCMP681" /NCGR_SAMPLE_ID=MMETSP1180 /ASSEMBLY_ACC=CAM_ASM_000741 /LENGTH=79 /DNA_ID=CAMNT_0007106049 /DNA_START=872 /DNA_END=1111 /DNA_ORIENTATION=-
MRSVTLIVHLCAAAWGLLRRKGFGMDAGCGLRCVRCGFPFSSKEARLSDRSLASPAVQGAAEVAGPNESKQFLVRGLAR